MLFRSNAVIRIVEHDSSTGKPSSAWIGETSSANTSLSGLTTGLASVSFTFSTPKRLRVGHTYWIVLSSINVVGNVWIKANTSGLNSHTVDSGGGWGALNNDFWSFVVSVTSPSALFVTYYSDGTYPDSI